LPIFRSNKAVSERKKLIKSKERELSQIQKELRTAKERVEQLEHKRRKKKLQLEIFQLKRELRAANKDGRVAEEEEEDGKPASKGALPEFLIIGAMKSGTTFLYNLLTHHPLVEPAVFKETHYFDKLIEEEGLQWYRRCFPEPGWREGLRTITGEATPSYLSHPLAPKRAARVVPQARLIALLRNPVDRAYSHYQQVARKGREPLTFEEAIGVKKTQSSGKNNEKAFAYEDGARLDESCAYLARSIYVDQLLRWSKFFGDEQMLVLKSEDFFERAPDTLKRVLDFLELPEWEPEFWGEIPKKRDKREYEGMHPATRRRLEEFFEPHNRRLYEHLGVDFGW
jgi:hypothetical protein